MCESFHQCIGYIFYYEHVLPVLACLSVILLSIQRLFLKVRPKFPITVNCWFCNSNTTVPYNSSNSWYCPKCDQYNGFTPDGSYNRVLTEQFNGRLNCDSWTVKAKQKRAATNGLCRFCNVNLELKVQQLAQFIPLSKDNYDEEVQQYSDQLERVYRLCSKCQSLLEKTLCEKQETYIVKQPKHFIAPPAKVTPKPSLVHAMCLRLTTLLTIGLLFSAIPRTWIEHVMASASLPDYIDDVLLVAQSRMPEPAQSLLILCFAGTAIQLSDWLVVRNTSSLVKMLLWITLPSLAYLPDHFDRLIAIIKVLVSVVLFITSATERRLENWKYKSAGSPHKFQKLDKKPELIPPRNRDTPGKEEKKNTTVSSKSIIADSSPTRGSPTLVHEPTPEDFGFGKLNVSTRRVTRSQLKPFQTKNYGSQVHDNLFKPKPVNLSPPKLHFDHSDYQVPLTRSSSQSSGFGSLSHQKDFDDCRPPSITGDDSVSQCAGGVVSRYHTNGFSPISLSNSFSPEMPFSHFQPYAIVHYSHAHFNKMFPYHNIPSIEAPFNQSSLKKEGGWSYILKNGLYSFCIFTLVLTNLAILWKEFGQDILKILK